MARDRAWHREYYRRNKLKYADNTLRRKYGITLAQKEEMLADQGGGCAICAATEPGIGGWAVDHCHVSGRIRGILCAMHNKGLGHFRDNPDDLRAAAAYLEHHSYGPIDNGGY